MVHQEPPEEPAEELPTIWQRPERASRGPVPEYSRAAIAAAGVALADAEGLAATTMRRVAAAIGTAPASLYRYLANRDELIALMADVAVGELSLTDLPSEAGWRADVLTVAGRLRALYRNHPWLLEYTAGGMSGAMFSPSAVDYLEGAVAALAELEVPARTKMEAVSMLTGVVGLFVKDELAGGNTSEQAQAANAAYLGKVVAAGRHPHLAAVMGQAAAEEASRSAAAADGDVTEEAGGSPADVFERVVLGVVSGLLRPHADRST